MLIRFWWPWPHFQGHRRAQIIEKWGISSCLHTISLLNGQILAKLTQVYHREAEKCWLDFGDLDPIFKVTGWLRLLENGLSAHYLLKEWIDFNQTCTSTLLGHVKELIRFDPIFKVAGGLRLLDNGLSARYLLNEWMDFDQTCTAILLRQRQELIRFFVDLNPIFKVTQGLWF